MTVPNVGDLLMLSQAAWMLEQAFAAGRKDAPADLQVIEAEIGGFARALKLLAEALQNTSPEVLQLAGRAVQDGISTIILSCQRTINDLDSLIDQYQVIKKRPTTSGFAIERTWSHLVLAEYKTMLWTTNGGTLQDLKGLLQLHTNFVALTTQAIQR
ncbi:hypothetical protein NX059_002026 [Plenodomus lindquistii]|nr:hypothetical protein NX059_002026 [Plenodomus lindquistii]